MRDTSMQSKPFGDELRAYLKRMNLSNTEFGRRVNLSESTIRNLLRIGVDPKAPEPQASVLLKVCSYTGIDPLYAFQRVYNFVADPQLLTENEDMEYLLLSYNLFSDDKRSILLSLIDSLWKSNELSNQLDQQQIKVIAGSVHKFVEQYPAIAQRRFSIVDQLGQKIGSLFPNYTEAEALAMCAMRLSKLAKDDASLEFTTSEEIAEVLAHPKVNIVINALLPRKSVPTNTQKLYWLLYFKSNDPGTERLSPEEKLALIALWKFVVSQTN